MGKLSLRRAAIITGIFVAGFLLLVFLRKLHVFGWWNNLNIINFLAAWIPFVISIFIAFVPEREMTVRQKWFWRSGVIVIGFIWSAVLWHQQVIMDTAAKTGQAEIVTKAVTQSNEHSDEQIAIVRDDVKGVKNYLGERMNQSEFNLNNSISKVNKPIAPELAYLQIYFWKDIDAREVGRTLSNHERVQVIDGKLHLEMMVTNYGPAEAKRPVDFVLRVLPGDWRLANEPEGLSYIPGSIPSERHLRFDSNMLRLSRSQKIIYDVIPKPGFATCYVQMFYSCDNCADDRNQQLTVDILR